MKESVSLIIYHSALCTLHFFSVHQHARAERLGDFECDEESQELLVVSAARADALALGFGEVLSQKQVEEVVVVGGCRERKLARVGRALGVVGGESGERVEEVVGRQVRALSREFYREA